MLEAHSSSQNQTESGAAFHRRPRLSRAVKRRKVFPTKGRACENSQRQYSEGGEFGGSRYLSGLQGLRETKQLEEVEGFRP